MLIDDVWGEETPDFPFSREKSTLTGNTQAIDNDSISRISRPDRRFLQANIRDVEYSTDENHGVHRASRDIAKTTGNPGTPGNASGANDLFFPLDRERTGNPGNAPSAGGYPPDAHSPSVATTAFPRQVDVFRCFICSVHETAEKPLLPVLSEDRGAHHWMHTGCWP